MQINEQKKKRSKCEAFKSENPVDTVKHGDGSIMLPGWFAGGGADILNKVE